MAKYCTECGSENEDDARYCGDCGKDVSGSTSRAARYEPPSPGNEDNWKLPMTETGTGDGMTFGYYLEGLRRYADFEGRASRAEFWWFILVFYGIQIAGAVASVALGMFSSALELLLTVMLFVHGLGLFLPQLAVTARRLHDTGRSGWWILISLVPFVGWIPLLIFLVLPSHAGPNEYGRGPGS